MLLRLRGQARPYHGALVQNPFNQALLAGALTTAATAQFLAKMCGFLQPYKAALQA